MQPAGNGPAIDKDIWDRESPFQKKERPMVTPLWGAQVRIGSMEPAEWANDFPVIGTAVRENGTAKRFRGNWI